MSLKDLSLNDLYERLWKLRAHNEFMGQDEYDVLEELKLREGERDR